MVYFNKIIMVIRCVVCSNKTDISTKIRNVSFHSFPSDPVIRAKWFKFCGLTESDIFTNSTICSDHFVIEDFIGNIAEGLNRRIKRGSIPTVRKKRKRVMPTIFLLPASYQPQPTVASPKLSSDGHIIMTNEHCVSRSPEFISVFENIPSQVQDESKSTCGAAVDQTSRNSRFGVLQESAPFSSTEFILDFADVPLQAHEDMQDENNSTCGEAIDQTSRNNVKI